MTADEIKRFIDDERKKRRISQEEISEAADLPDLGQTYQRFMRRPRGSLYTAVSLLAAMGLEVEVRKAGEKH